MERTERAGKPRHRWANPRGRESGSERVNGMNTPCWEAGGWTALVGGNPTERIGRSRVSDMAGNAARVAVECSGRCRDTNLKSYIRRSCSKTRTTSSEAAQWTGRTAEEHMFLARG